MGWSCYITADKEISEDHVDKILRDAPGPFAGIFPAYTKKQDWGWSSGVDVSMPWPGDEYQLKLSGSYGMSGAIAEDYAEWISGELTKVGYEIKSKVFNW